MSQDGNPMGVNQSFNNAGADSNAANTQANTQPTINSNVAANNQTPVANQYHQSGIPQYPQQSMPMYQQPGMPQYPRSGYPNSGMPYYQQPGMPMYGMGQYMPGQPKKKMSTMKFAAIFVGIVLLVAIAAVVFLLVLNKDGKDEQPKTNVTNIVTSENETQQDSTEEKSVLPELESFKEFEVKNPRINIDNSMYVFQNGLYNMDNVNYVSLSQMAKMFELPLEIDMEKLTATIVVNENTFVLTHAVVEGDKISTKGKVEKIPLTRPPILFTNGDMYVSIKGLTEVLDFKRVDWDNDNNCVKITTNTVKIPQ